MCDAPVRTVHYNTAPSVRPFCRSGVPAASLVPAGAGLLFLWSAMRWCT